MHRTLGGRMAHYTFLFHKPLELQYNQEKEIQLHCSIIWRNEKVKEKLIAGQKNKL